MRAPALLPGGLMPFGATGLAPLAAELEATE